METQQTPMTQEQMLLEIYENTRKTKKYMQWQFYITIVLVVLPVIGIIISIPLLMNSLSSAYGVGLGGLVQ